VFGSFGWSGEAVDEMESKLEDGGYGFAFKPIKVKFKPTTKVITAACTPNVVSSYTQAYQCARSCC
jgi:flavorubredoxin